MEKKAGSGCRDGRDVTQDPDKAVKFSRTRRVFRRRGPQNPQMGSHDLSL